MQTIFLESRNVLHCLNKQYSRKIHLNGRRHSPPSMANGFFPLFLNPSLPEGARQILPNGRARKFLTYTKIFSQEDFALKSKLRPWYFLLHRLRHFFSSRNKGQLRAAVTRPCRLPTPLSHTYSEPSGHELSPGGTQNIPYLFKNLSKSRLSDPFFGLFLVISEVGSQIYIANLAIFKI